MSYLRKKKLRRVRSPFEEELEWLSEFETELDWLNEIEAEVNRTSKNYIKWLQRQLNRIESAGLAVDGLMGLNTSNAIRAFQKKYGVVYPPDGKPSETLDGFLIMFGATPPPTSTASSHSKPVGPYPVVNTLMPKQGPGFYCRMSESRRWGLPETIEALQEIGSVWYMTHSIGPRIIISDISKRGGGKLCFSNGNCHTSHQIGLDVDIRTMRNDGKDTLPSAVSYNSKNYSLKLTRQLIELIRNNGILKIKTIGFLDPRIPNLSRWSGHSKHLHVRFCMPKKYQSVIDLRKTYTNKQKTPNYRC